MKTIAIILALLLTQLGAKDKPTSILLITADDLGYEVLPFLGGSTKDLSPNLSKLASEGMSFHNAHVNKCQSIKSTKQKKIKVGSQGGNC